MLSGVRESSIPALVGVGKPASVPPGSWKRMVWPVDQPSARLKTSGRVSWKKPSLRSTLRPVGLVSSSRVKKSFGKGNAHISGTKGSQGWSIFGSEPPQAARPSVVIKAAARVIESRCTIGSS